jgi:hypothetical protein
LREIAPGHFAACHWAEQISDGKLQPQRVVSELGDEPEPEAVVG